GRAVDSTRRSGTGCVAGQRGCLHRCAACRTIRPGDRAIHVRSIPSRREGAGLSTAVHARAGLSTVRPAREQTLPRQARRAVRAIERTTAGPDVARSAGWQDRSRRNSRHQFLRVALAEHERRIFRRSDLRRQSRFCRLEADRLSRPALQLYQRDRTIRPAIQAAICQPRRARSGDVPLERFADRKVPWSGLRTWRASSEAGLREPDDDHWPRVSGGTPLMAKKLPEVEVVLVGFGWTASIIAQELTDAGMQVLALERGGWRDTVPDFSVTHIQDELRYAVRKEIFEQTRRQTLTFRNRVDQLALPMRQLGSFLPASGVGGAGVHWNGQNWRFLPTDFLLRTHNEQRYGKKAIPDDMTIQDWGVTYEQLEPYYDKWEYLCGISGKAGNIGGAIQPGGNPFEGPRRREYPLPPLKRCAATQLFDKAAREAGFHPFPAPAANTSKPYLNPLGVQMGQCTFCGYCEWFGCANYSKASPQTTILPVLLKKDNFSFRTHANVVRVLTDSAGKRATGVAYVDQDGKQYIQPAQMVVLCAFAHHNVHLLLVSKIGTPYDPSNGAGVVGRNYAYQVSSDVNVTCKERLNPFMGAGALGQVV